MSTRASKKRSATRNIRDAATATLITLTCMPGTLGEASPETRPAKPERVVPILVTNPFGIKLPIKIPKTVINPPLYGDGKVESDSKTTIFLTNVSNMPLKEASQRVDAKIQDNDCGPTLYEIPKVPVYTYLGGEPIQVNFDYMPGDDTLIGTENENLPKGKHATDGDFYGYLEGKRYLLESVISLDVQAGQTDYNISLALPDAAPVPTAPTC